MPNLWLEVRPLRAIARSRRSTARSPNAACDWAAQAAVPYLQKTFADKAVIDLNPFAADAKKRIATAVGDFATQANGLTANVTVDDLGLAGIAYDANTLRIIASANGTVNVAISSLAGQ